MIQLYRQTYQSPIGDIEILFDDDKLVYLDFSDNHERLKKLLTTRYGNYETKPSNSQQTVIQMLDRYFAGESEEFAGLNLATGGTDFQQSVWKQLRGIRRGDTMDYASLAAKAGNAKAVRAAASSNARNPISIVIPCHRVIGKDGSLRGYAGGVERKRFLLELEGVVGVSKS